MDNKTCLITGCNGGIGKQAAIQLARQGFNIIMLVRDSDKSRLACEEIKREAPSATVDLLFADLASMDSVKKAAEKIKTKYETIDILINNAGVLKRTFEQTPEGFEMTFAVNYLAPFLLTTELLPVITRSKQGRIVNVGSELYKRGNLAVNPLPGKDNYDGQKAYSTSKMLLLLFTQELAQRLDDENVSVNCLHPGVIATDVFRDFPVWLSKLLGLFIGKPSQGAKPIVHLATSAEVSQVSGAYFNKLKQSSIIAPAKKKSVAAKIWKDTVALLESWRSAN
jgi:NAD(P)-dependent dehydrogenase (short-subunit alcohol dehydrogenase family)